MGSIDFQGKSLNGFADYNDTATTGTPIVLTGGVFSLLTNDGLGAQTNVEFLPTGVERLLDTSTGKIDVSDLDLGDYILLRPDFTVTPGTNNQFLTLQYTLGSGGGAFTIPSPSSRLEQGSGVPHRIALDTKLIYMGNVNTRDNPIGVEIMTSGNGTVINSGIAISVVKRNA